MSSYRVIILAKNASSSAARSKNAVARYTQHLLKYQRPLSSCAYDESDATNEILDDDPNTTESSTKVRCVEATNVPVGRLFSSFAALESSTFDIPSDGISQSFPDRPFSEQNPSQADTDDDDDEDDDDGDGDEISMRELHALASQPCTPVSVADMYKYGSSNPQSKNYSPERLRNAIFLHKELQIRIAQRAVDLFNLPHGLNMTTHVQEIAHIYLRYLRLFQDTPCPSNKEEELAFTDMLRVMVLDRSSIPMAIAQGIACLKDKRKEELDMQSLEQIEVALYRFFNARVGLRLLTEHHILSCVERQEEYEELRSRQTCLDNVPLNGGGCIKADCNPAAEVQRVATEVMLYCRECYGVTPEIEILDCTPEKYSNAYFTFVPHHLQFMLAELLRNSCRSVVKRYTEGGISVEDESANIESGVLPPIRVVIVKGAEDVTIKIADKGGGVARSVIDRMWTFMHAPLGDEVESTKNNKNVENKYIGRNSRGFGLPLSRIYARYLGGELTVKTMEGDGVDAYLHLPRLGDAGENIPKRVLLSPGNTDSTYDGNRNNTQQLENINIGGDEPWAGSQRHFSTCSLAQLRKNAL